jgi:hypothetical protein
MTKVYTAALLTNPMDNASETQNSIYGVFSTREKAEAFAKKFADEVNEKNRISTEKNQKFGPDWFFIEEFEIDAENTSKAETFVY